MNDINSPISLKIFIFFSQFIQKHINKHKIQMEIEIQRVFLKFLEKLTRVDYVNLDLVYNCNNATNKMSLDSTYLVVPPRNYTELFISRGMFHEMPFRSDIGGMFQYEGMKTYF